MEGQDSTRSTAETPSEPIPPFFYLMRGKQPKRKARILPEVQLRPPAKQAPPLLPERGGKRLKKKVNPTR
eukprot:scaffold128050_cov14-Tisochrysis_lutea.AAC.1